MHVPALLPIPAGNALKITLVFISILFLCGLRFSTCGTSTTKVLARCALHLPDDIVLVLRFVAERFPSLRLPSSASDQP